MVNSGGTQFDVALKEAHTADNAEYRGGRVARGCPLLACVPSPLLGTGLNAHCRSFVIPQITVNRFCYPHVTDKEIRSS